MAIKKICKQNLTKWHNWFAWYPVTFDTRVNGDRICWYRAFWTTVQRKKVYSRSDDEWEYRLPQHAE